MDWNSIMFSKTFTIAFSGEICSGKSSVSKILVEQYGFYQGKHGRASIEPS